MCFRFVRILVSLEFEGLFHSLKGSLLIGLPLYFVPLLAMSTIDLLVLPSDVLLISLCFDLYFLEKHDEKKENFDTIGWHLWTASDKESKRTKRDTKQRMSE